MSGVTIGITTINGKPLDAVPKNVPFRVQVKLPRPVSGDPPATIQVKFKSKAGTQTLTLAWTKNYRGPALYRSQPIKMESGAEGGGTFSLGVFEWSTGGMGGLTTENGEDVQVSYDGVSTSIRIYDSWHDLTIAQLRKMFDIAAAYWKAIKNRLSGVDDDDAKKLFNLAVVKLGLIQRGRAYLDNDQLWPRERTAIASLYLGWLQSAGLDYDSRTETSAVSETKRRARDRSMEVILREVQNIALGFYAVITNATNTAQIFTLFTGKTIFGKKATFSEKVAAALDLAAAAAGEAAGMKLNLNRMRSRPGREEGAAGIKFTKPKEGIDPEVVDAGEFVLGADFGIHRFGVRHARRVADKHNVIFVVRPANLDSMHWQALGYPRKPKAIKDKTIGPLDIHIGARKEDIGLVGHFKPKEPTRPPGMDDKTWGRVQKRYKDRSEAWDLNHPKLVKLEKEGKIELKDGLIIDRGLCGNTGKPITGDYDLFGVYNRKTGALVDAKKVDIDILPDLRGGGFRAKHGAHLNWRPEDTVGQGIFKGILGRHTSTNKGREALFVVGGRGDGPAYTTFYDLDFKLPPLRIGDIGSRPVPRVTFGRRRFTELLQSGRGVKAKPKVTATDDAGDDASLEEWIKDFSGGWKGFPKSILEENGDEEEGESDEPAKTVKVGSSEAYDDNDPNVTFSTAWYKAGEGKLDPWANSYEDDDSENDDVEEDKKELESPAVADEGFEESKIDASKLPSWVLWVLGGGGVACLLSAACFIIFGTSWFLGQDFLRGEDPAPSVTEPVAVVVETVPTTTPLPSPTEPPSAEDLVAEMMPEFQVTGRQAIAMGMPSSDLLALAGFFTKDDPLDWIFSVPGVPVGLESGTTDIQYFIGGRFMLTGGSEFPIFSQSLFPCGETGERTVVCSTEAEVRPMPPGEIVMAVMVLGEPIPEPVRDPEPGIPTPLGPGESEHIYAFIVDKDDDPANNFVASSQFAWDYYQDTDTWVELVGNPSSGTWALYVTDEFGGLAASSARAVIESNVIAFFIGSEELGDTSLARYRMSAFLHDGNYNAATSSGDVTGSDPTEPPIPLVETGLEFPGPPQ
jgi:hypothetical protein